MYTEQEICLQPVKAPLMSADAEINGGRIQVNFAYRSNIEVWNRLTCSSIHRLYIVCNEQAGNLVRNPGENIAEKPQ